METSTHVIGRNIIELRDALGLSQKDFADLTNISTSTLVNIESKNRPFHLKSIEGIINFTKIELDDLSKRDFVVPRNLREKLIKKYKSDPSISVLLNKEPSIPYCIKYKLLKSDFLNTPKETKQIREYFLKLGFNFKGNSIHSAIKRIPHLINIEKHPIKKSTNLYSKKI